MNQQKYETKNPEYQKRKQDTKVFLWVKGLPIFDNVKI